MKLSIQISLTVVIVFFLYGCPYESPYAIDEEPQQNIDSNLLGKWAAFVPKPTDDKHYKEDPVKIIFSQRTSMEYDIVITGYIDELKPFKVVLNDSIKGTAFISNIGKHRFLNAIFYSKVYVAAIKQDAKNLSIACLSEHFTARYIKNSHTLRTAIEFHYRTRPMPTFDDWFVLKNLHRVN